MNKQNARKIVKSDTMLFIVLFIVGALISHFILSAVV